MMMLLALILLSFASQATLSLVDSDWNSKLARGNSEPLVFRSDNHFKLVQFTDLHYGERYGNGSYAPWGPVQDNDSTVVMDYVLTIEKPDVVVLTGDLLTANNIYENATKYWSEIVEVCIRHDVRWMVTFGNHDDMSEEWNKSDTGHQNWREKLLYYDIHNFSDWSLSQFGPTDMFGTTNYYLPIYKDDSLTGVGAYLYLLDSGGGALEEQITADQVSWLTETFESHHSDISLIFQHIPIHEYGVAVDDTSSETECWGMNHDPPSQVKYENNEFATLQSFKADTNSTVIMSVGHNHGNDFCCNYKEIWLCCGRHTGYGGYSDWTRGGRVYEFCLDCDYRVQTWVRLETGEVWENHTLA